MEPMRIETLDQGKLLVNAAYKELLEMNGLNTFEDIMDYSGGQVAKRFTKYRHTTQLWLESQDKPVSCFLKRHTRPPLKEYIKPLVRLTKPMIGAESEWHAMFAFRRHKVPTMTPLVLGKKGGRSFTMTLGIEGCVRASEWFREHCLSSPSAFIKRSRCVLIVELARVVRTMHQAGLNHQDLYLCHFLVRFTNDRPDVFVIDVQRAMKHKGRLPDRWRIKDLAQFNYSAVSLNDDEKGLFWKEYFAGCEDLADRLLAAIMRKSERIRRHSQKHNL